MTSDTVPCPIESAVGSVTMRIVLFVLVVICILPAQRSLATGESCNEKTLSPYFLVEGGDEGKDSFPLKATSVKVTIDGVIADVKVIQEYANNGARPINARYIFPASTRAAVHGMRMTVGEDVVEARIAERKEARKAFEKAKKEGKNASLLEQQRPNVFSMDVANIMPGESVTVELHYSELLVPKEGEYSFVFPTVVGPRYSTIGAKGADDHHQWLSNPYLKEGKEPESTFAMEVTLGAGMPIGKIACTSHSVDVAWEGKSKARITLSKDEKKGGDRDFILAYRLSGDKIQTGLLLQKGEKENFFLLMMQPPKRVTSEAIPPREFVFVLDVSGSMHGFPLDTAKALIRGLVGGLRPVDSFNVVLFAGSARALSDKPVPATQANIESALRVIDGQRGGGGTELRNALEKALEMPRTEGRARIMIVITDGYIAAEREVFGLIADNLDKCSVFTFGIGSAVNRYLIEGLARAGKGEPFVVTSPREAPSAAARFKAYVQSPVLTGVKVEFNDFEAYDVEPAVVPDLFASRPIIVCGKWKGEPRGTITVKGSAGSGSFEQTADAGKAEPSDSSSALACLWARKRLERISDMAHNPQDEEVKSEIVRLGLKYKLLTRFTSFVAVHEVVKNVGVPAEDVKQPLPLPRHVSNLSVGCPRNAPEPGISVTVGLLCVVLFVGWLCRRRRRVAHRM